MKEMNLRDGGTVSYVVLLVLLLDLSVVLGSLTGCGGGSTASTPASSDATLTSIAVTPTNPSIAVGGTQQFTAKGTYSDGSTQDITKSVTWKSSNAAKAPIKSSGLAIGVAAGSFTVTATLSGKSGTATLTITNPSATLTSISVVPLDPTIGLGGSQQFFASGIYSDSSIQDVTRSATWTSSDTTKATVQSTGQAGPGLATGVAAGSVTIAAALSGKRGSTTLTVSSSGNATMIPLTDITSSQSYLSFPGGLYENVSNTPPPDHNTAGLSTATAIQPLDANGNPSSSGKIVFVSIGRSTAQDEFSVFVGQAAADSGVNHTTLVIANGALATARPCAWTIASGAPPCDPTLGNEYDRVRDTVLAPLGVTEKQVQITWIEEYDADPGGAGFQTLCDPTVAGCSNDLSHTEALHFEQELGEILRAAKTRWPNLKQAYHSSRIYGGYSTVTHSYEPYAYEYGFSVKWLIEAQILQMRSGGTIDPIAGDLNYNNGTAPWTAWGPYLWANGDMPRSDGLFWCNGQLSSPCNGEVDFQPDGTHPNPQGQQKVAKLLMNFFLTSPYTPWFRT